MAHNESEWPRMTHHHLNIRSIVSEMILDQEIGKLSQKQKRLPQGQKMKKIYQRWPNVKKGSRKNFIPKQFLIAG